MIYVVIAILFLVMLIVFGVAWAADGIAHAKQAQATIEVAQVAQTQAVTNMISILVLAVVALVLAIILVAVVVLAIRYLSQRKEQVWERPRRRRLGVAQAKALLDEVKTEATLPQNQAVVYQEEEELDEGLVDWLLKG